MSRDKDSRAGQKGARALDILASYLSKSNLIRVLEHRRHSLWVPRDNTGALSRSVKKNRRESRRHRQSERSQNPVSQRYRVKRNNINDSTISSDGSFSAVFSVNITLIISANELVSYFANLVSHVVSTRKDTFATASM